jgi:SPP1 family predicted phage head-tail adaptor
MNYYNRETNNYRKSQASQAQHYIYIQTLVSTTDEEGGFSEQWTSGSAIPAAIIPLQARQVMQYKSINVDATHLIKVRGRTTIAEESRILFGSRVFEILTVENIQERNFIKVITCKEKRE